MKVYTVYTDRVSYKPEHQPAARIGGATPVYYRRVLADNRTGALTKCLPDIRQELPKVKGKFLSVFVGETHNPTAAANRMTPIQIVIETGELRK